MSTVSTQQVVERMATAMEYKFSVRRNHGDREAWLKTDVSRLLERLEEETIELYKAIQNHKAGTGPAMSVVLECADVNNISTMIADSFGLMEMGEFMDDRVEVADEHPVK